MTDNNRAEALAAVSYCLKMIRNDRIPKKDNAIWSSGSSQQPRITEDILETIQEALSPPPDNAEAVRVEELLDLLELIYDGYENGAPCYETSDGENGSYLGNAFKLDHVQEKQIEDILNKHRPRTAVVAAMKEGV